MDALYDLKDMLVQQLEDYGEKGELSNAVLERVDTLAHAVKNLDKIIECCEEDEFEKHRSYKSRSSRTSRGVSSRGSRRSNRVGNERHYAYDHPMDGELVDQLYSLMNSMPDDQSKQELQRLADRLDQM